MCLCFTSSAFSNKASSNKNHRPRLLSGRKLNVKVPVLQAWFFAVYKYWIQHNCRSCHKLGQHDLWELLHFPRNVLSREWNCEKRGAPGQRWIDLLRLGWSLSPWPTGSTGSKLRQPPSSTGVLSVHPSWAMQHQQPGQLGCSTFTCFTTQGWCLCLGKGSSCLMEQAAVSTLQRHSTLGMALLTVGAEPHPSCCSRSSSIYLLWVPLPATPFQRRGLKNGLTKQECTALGEEMLPRGHQQLAFL